MVEGVNLASKYLLRGVGAYLLYNSIAYLDLFRIRQFNKNLQPYLDNNSFIWMASDDHQNRDTWVYY